MKQKDIYLIGHKSWDNASGIYRIDYLMDNPPHRANVLEYWHTFNIDEAKRFYSKEEVFQYLIDNPQQFDKAILLNYTEEYLASLEPSTKEYISKFENL